MHATRVPTGRGPPDFRRAKNPNRNAARGISNIDLAMMLSPLNTPRAKQIKPETRNGGISFSKPTPLPDFIMETGILERSSVIKQSFSRKSWLVGMPQRCLPWQAIFATGYSITLTPVSQARSPFSRILTENLLISDSKSFLIPKSL
jgi:hypothetical protein